jgi:hypothetical protein
MVLLHTKILFQATDYLEIRDISRLEFYEKCG